MAGMEEVAGPMLEGMEEEERAGGTAGLDTVGTDPMTMDLEETMEATVEGVDQATDLEGEAMEEDSGEWVVDLEEVVTGMEATDLGATDMEEVVTGMEAADLVARDMEEVGRWGAGEGEGDGGATQAETQGEACMAMTMGRHLGMDMVEMDVVDLATLVMELMAVEMDGSRKTRWHESRTGWRHRDRKTAVAI